MTDPLPVTRADVEAAHAAIRPLVRRTPVIAVERSVLGLGDGSPLALKLEQLQHTGSFKARGASWNLLSGDLPEAGVAGASGGNHGAALAWAAARAGVPCDIFVFSHTPDAKAKRIEGYGARVHRVSSDFDELMAATHDHVDATGARLVHAYDQPGTLAGQGTVALEFLADADVDTLLVATGGGGLIGGMAAYAENRVKVVSVEPEACPQMHAALEAGKPVPVPSSGYARDSLGPALIGALGFAVAQQFVDDAVLVPDDAIRGAQATLWDRLRLVVEPGGAAALAALTSGAYQPEPDERVGVLLCGANVDAVHWPD
ncbi:MAG: serine/threonine dehydratase [Pseudomonadota bacterium]